MAWVNCESAGLTIARRSRSCRRCPAGSLLRGDPDHPFWEDNVGPGDYLTVNEYPGVLRLGHVGIGVNSDTTMGYYPRTKSWLRFIPQVLGMDIAGVEKPDIYHPPEDSVTLPVSPDQAAVVRDFLNNRVAHPGDFNLWVRDCANTVEDALAAAGIATPRTMDPKTLLDNLKQPPLPWWDTK